MTGCHNGITEWRNNGMTGRHNGMTELKAVAVTYAGYGRTVSRHAAKLFLLGLVLAGVACVGLINVQTTNDVLNIWM